jgi:predicted phosphate transport protein (TIGR00153 family)
MKRLFHNFFADKALFFDLFDTDTRNMVDMAKTLVTVAETEQADKRDVLCQQISKMENTGNEITHKIHLYLDKYTFTPLNRKDIHALASAINNVADTIKETGARIQLYNIACIVPPMRQIAAIILNAVTELKKAVDLLRFAQNGLQVIEICRKVKNFERQADNIYYTALSDLFINDTDAINVIKNREILLALETTVNQCKCTADALETILINR